MCIKGDVFLTFTRMHFVGNFIKFYYPDYIMYNKLFFQLDLILVAFDNVREKNDD